MGGCFLHTSAGFFAMHVGFFMTCAAAFGIPIDVGIV